MFVDHPGYGNFEVRKGLASDIVIWGADGGKCEEAGDDKNFCIVGS